jgi:hypothetical protein
MAPPGQLRRVRVHRAAAVILGLAMTSGTIVWFMVAALAVWRDTGVDRQTAAPMAAWPFWAAAASTVVAAGLLVLAATFMAAGYERFRPASWTHPPRSWSWPWGRGLASRLDDAGFYDNRREHEVRWRIHVVVAALTWLALTAAVVAGNDVDHPDPTLGWAIVLTGCLQMLAVVVMAAVALFPDEDATRSIGWRLLGAGTAATAVMLLGGLVLSAVMAVVGIKALPAGPAVMLYDVYGLALLAALGAVVGSVVYRMQSRTAPEVHRATGHLVSTLGARLRARLALSLSHLDIVILGFAGTFVAGSSVAFAARWWDETSLEDWRLTSTPLVDLARLSFAGLIGFLILNLVKSRANPAALRRLGNIWDVITFWPRAYHPFAVRPYAERAVPELQEFLRHGRRHDPLVITAHSQGSILAYAALRPLLVVEGGTGPDHPLPPTRLITFGSPLQSLYCRAFPHYFDLTEISEMREALGGRWINFFRFTDHVGRAVFSPDEQVAASHLSGGPAADRPLSDPARDGRVRGHNLYWNEPAIRAAVAQWSPTPSLV